jgi:hypothetical protein
MAPVAGMAHTAAAILTKMPTNQRRFDCATGKDEPVRRHLAFLALTA